MAKFADLDEFIEDTLTLPSGGKAYTIPSPDADLGLWCQRLYTLALQINEGQTPSPIPPLKALPDDPDQTPLTADTKGAVSQDERLYRRLLGPVWDQLNADGVTWPRIKMICETTVFWVGAGLEVAETYWNSGGNPEALRPNRKARRSTATGGASSTKKAVSGSGTKSRATASKRLAQKS